MITPNQIKLLRLKKFPENKFQGPKKLQSRTKFAELFGVTWRTVQSWEYGTRTPHPTVMIKLKRMIDSWNGK